MIAQSEPQSEKRTIEFWGNSPGKFMELLRTVEEGPMSDAELKEAAETMLKVLRPIKPDFPTQFVLVEGGFILAVEDMATGKFRWCSR